MRSVLRGAENEAEAKTYEAAAVPEATKFGIEAIVASRT